MYMTSSLLKEREENNLINKTRILSNLLDSELRKIKQVSLNLAYSDTLKESVEDYMYLKRTIENPETLYYAVRKIQSVLNETVGPLKQVSQVNILLPDSEMICFGIYNLRQELPEYLLPRLQRLFNEKRTSWWSPPERDFLSESLGMIDSSKNYISHYQILFDDIRTPLAYIEVKQETGTLFEELLAAGDDFQVFNAHNLQLFPRTMPYGNSYSSISSEIIPYRIFHRQNVFTQKKEVLCLGISTETSWRIINILSESRYMSPIYRIQISLIPLVILIALLGYFISHHLSRGISIPLTKLNSKLNQVQWKREDKIDLPPEKTSIQELNDLEVSFIEMNRKMDEKLDMFVAEKTLEVNARMLALQSQMDPHFLFNMLSIIDIMADEGQDKEIQQVIRHLSSLLRYTSSLKELVVPIAMELKMAEHYMECISFRFGKMVQFSAVIPDDVRELKIPKHSFIPLLENAIKYGMPEDKPCKVRLYVNTNSQNWSVSVEDNGPGFAPESLAELTEKIKKGLADPQLQLNNQIKGLGLFNICARYSLLYGKDFIFLAENRKEEGAIITLGGSIHA